MRNSDRLERDLDPDFIVQYEQISKVYNFKHDITKPTQVLFDAQQHIRNILDGSYLIKMKWDNVWLQKQDLSSLENPSFDVILSAVKEFAKAVSPGGWLAESPPKISLSAFFYNRKTQKSFFIMMLQKHKKVPLMGQEYLEFLKPVQQFASSLKLEVADVEYSLYSIYTYWNKFFTKLIEYQPLSRRDYWYTHFGTRVKWSTFMSIYTDFMMHRRKVSKYDVGLDSPAWYGFVRYVYINYNKLKIAFSKTFYRKIEEGVDSGSEDTYIDSGEEE